MFWYAPGKPFFMGSWNRITTWTRIPAFLRCKYFVFLEQEKKIFYQDSEINKSYGWAVALKISQLQSYAVGNQAFSVISPQINHIPKFPSNDNIKVDIQFLTVKGGWNELSFLYIASFLKCLQKNLVWRTST